METPRGYQIAARNARRAISLTPASRFPNRPWTLGMTMWADRFELLRFRQGILGRSSDLRMGLVYLEGGL